MRQQFNTERLILKVLDRSAAIMVLAYYLRNQRFLEEWEPQRATDFYTAQYHAVQLDKELDDFINKRALRLWLFKNNEENKIIGNIAFSNIVRGAFLSCHLGYKCDEDEENKGYITEAIKKGVEIIFDDAGLHRIEANIMPKNKKSLRVVEKLGFYNEGLAYKYLKINGVWEDHIHMVLLNEKL